MSAEEALQMARVTLECGGDRLLRGCVFGPLAPCDSETVCEPFTVAEAHRWHASALLDGFSVEELTAVGG